MRIRISVHLHSLIIDMSLTNMHLWDVGFYYFSEQLSYSFLFKSIYFATNLQKNASHIILGKDLF